MFVMDVMVHQAGERGVKGFLASGWIQTATTF